MIFLSHNHKDKPIVEEFALRLRDIFGEPKIFFDAWSIQPGDGIVDKMNEGLSKCELFLFFVSKNSLQSKMVALEWQNAVIKATQGQAKIVPIKLDDCLMPAILLQSLYIDLFGQGIEIAMRQIVDIASGRNTFRPGPQRYSNLRAFAYASDISMIVEVRAEHFMEPISHFLFLVRNREDEFSFSCQSAGMSMSAFHADLKVSDGSTANGAMLTIETATVPGFPFVAEFRPLEGKRIDLKGVMHEKRRNEWLSVPMTIGTKPSN